MEIKIYQAIPERMEKVPTKARDGFQLKFVGSADNVLNRDVVNLLSVYVYNGHDVNISRDNDYTQIAFRRRTSLNTSAFYFREFSPAELKVCLMCQHLDSRYSSRNLKKVHCKVCRMEYHVCDQCMKKVDFDLLTESEQNEYRWNQYKVSVDSYKYTDHECYLSKNFCSTACLESYKILPQEKLD